MNPEKRTILPKVAFTGFASRYREPRDDEGFQDITKVDFKVRDRATCNVVIHTVGAAAY
jgi:bifunctional polynucleotide phosphatase/kinase